jgi:hypothetical protein
MDMFSVSFKKDGKLHTQDMESLSSPELLHAVLAGATDITVRYYLVQFYLVDPKTWEAELYAEVAMNDEIGVFYDAFDTGLEGCMILPAGMSREYTLKEALAIEDEAFTGPVWPRWRDIFCPGHYTCRDIARATEKTSKTKVG